MNNIHFRITKSIITLTSSLAIGLAFTSSVSANDLLERLEVATEALGVKQGEFFVSRVPELKDKLPSWEWDDEMREATGCVLSGIEAKKGRKIAEDYVAALEQDVELEITSLTQLGKSIPPELKGNDPTLGALMQSCRTMEISIQRMQESGLWKAMNDPLVMQRLVTE